MTGTPRWLKAVKDEAGLCRTRLPWERGLRRAAAVARRAAEAKAPPPLRRAS